MYLLCVCEFGVFLFMCFNFFVMYVSGNVWCKYEVVCENLSVCWCDFVFLLSWCICVVFSCEFWICFV